MWIVQLQKRHYERLAGQLGLAYIRAKAQRGVVWIGDTYSCLCNLTQQPQSILCKLHTGLTTPQDTRPCSFRRQVGWHPTLSFWGPKEDGITV